jgi:DNA polymerase II large subunit
MPAVRTVGILFIVLAAGCARVEEGPYSESPSASKPAVPVKMSKKDSASPKKLEPPLDVAALKTRLRETHAIGVFTKLALKNQMDDLLEQFRAHYQSGQKTSVASLRQPYEMLVLKVLSLVQDGDPSLARTISGSREAIWAILADKEKFNSVS